MTVNVQGTDSIQEISILTEPPYGYLPEERVQERVHQYLTSVYKRLGQEQP